MRRLINRFKAITPKYQGIIKTSIVFFFIIFFTTYGVFALNNQTKLLPENPLRHGADDNSQVPLLSGFMDLIHAEELPEEERNKEEEQTEKEQKENDQENKEGSSETEIKKLQELQPVNDNPASGANNEDNQQQAEDGETAGDNAGIGDNHKKNNLETPDIEINNPEDDKGKEINQYFTTSITNGETVTKENYSFQIRQLNHAFPVQNIDVNIKPDTGNIDHITDEMDPIVQVNLSLAKGENEITIGITYQDEAGKDFTVYRDYTVHFDEESIIIVTDLKDTEVFDESISFSVKAALAGESIPITVKVNGKTLAANENTTYRTELNEGQNEITIAAEYKGLQASKKYTIYYQKPNLTIDTDLQDQTVNEADFYFQAKAYDGKERVKLAIHHDSNEIAENGEGQYSVTLMEGDNSFQLTALKGEVEHTETYNIFYAPENSNDDNEQEEDKNAPTITVHDLENGETIKNKTRTFHVRATSYAGKSLTGGSGVVSATNNGSSIGINWTDSAQISFTLTLQNGENHIIITAKDQEGNTATEELVVYGDIVEEGEAIGNVTISLEATTVGLGHIIPAQQMEIYQGERGSHVIDRLFNEHGITYDYTGTHVNSFYLSTIYREGVVKNPIIPDDLAELVKYDFSRFEPEDYLPDSLGEFDFSNGSGWMYSVNGVYPNVGFADYYFKDGDVVRIRFTIALGADIGGGMPGSIYGKEW